MATSTLANLHPVFRTRVESILRDLTAKGWQPVVASGVRTEAEQAAKVRQGYSQTKRSWHVSSTAQTMSDSGHSYSVVRGAAADIVDKRYGWGGPASDLNFQFWIDLGAAAADYGLEWGGDWASFRDVAHVQMRFIEDAPRTSAYV
jgi:peptidoglycan LD-endopeptidase CwlK